MKHMTGRGWRWEIYEETERKLVGILYGTLTWILNKHGMREETLKNFKKLGK